MPKPTLCRSLLFHPAPYDELFEAGAGPMAAVVKFVDESDLVNVTVFNRRSGETYGRNGMQVIEHGAEPPKDVSYCEWPPRVDGGWSGRDSKANDELQLQLKSIRDDVSALANLVTKPDVIEALSARVDGLAELVAKLQPVPAVEPTPEPAAQ